MRKRLIFGATLVGLLVAYTAYHLNRPSVEEAVTEPRYSQQETIESSEVTPDPEPQEASPLEKQVKESIGSAPTVTIEDISAMKGSEYMAKFNIICEDPNGDLLLYRTFLNGIELPATPLVGGGLLMGGPVSAFADAMNKPTHKVESQIGFPGLRPGSYELRIIVKDEKGNIGEEVRKFDIPYKT